MQNACAGRSGCNHHLYYRQRAFCVDEPDQPETEDDGHRQSPEQMQNDVEARPCAGSHAMQPTFGPPDRGCDVSFVTSHLPPDVAGLAASGHLQESLARYGHHHEQHPGCDCSHS